MQICRIMGLAAGSVLAGLGGGRGELNPTLTPLFCLLRSARFLVQDDQSSGRIAGQATAQQRASFQSLKTREHQRLGLGEITGACVRETENALRRGDAGMACGERLGANLQSLLGQRDRLARLARGA